MASLQNRGAKAAGRKTHTAPNDIRLHAIPKPRARFQERMSPPCPSSRPGAAGTASQSPLGFLGGPGNGQQHRMAQARVPWGHSPCPAPLQEGSHTPRRHPTPRALGPQADPPAGQNQNCNPGVYSQHVLLWLLVASKGYNTTCGQELATAGTVAKTTHTDQSRWGSSVHYQHTEACSTIRPPLAHTWTHTHWHRHYHRCTHTGLHTLGHDHMLTLYQDGHGSPAGISKDGSSWGESTWQNRVRTH